MFHGQRQRPISKREHSELILSTRLDRACEVCYLHGDKEDESDLDSELERGSGGGVENHYWDPDRQVPSRHGASANIPLARVQNM